MLCSTSSILCRNSINIVTVIQPVVLVFVVVLITSIIAPGFVVILPALDPVGSPLHLLRFGFGMWLAFNTILNFLASVLKPAGALPILVSICVSAVGLSLRVLFLALDLGTGKASTWHSC